MQQPLHPTHIRIFPSFGCKPNPDNNFQIILKKKYQKIFNLKKCLLGYAIILTFSTLFLYDSWQNLCCFLRFFFLLSSSTIKYDSRCQQQQQQQLAALSQQKQRFCFKFCF